MLRSSRVLVHYDPQLPIVLACDASSYGLGAVLSHQLPTGEEKPVAFASRTLTPTEQKYSHLDKEALAIVFGVKKFHSYIYGRHFVLKTDHQPLTHIFKENRAVPTMASGRVQRWALTLGAYSYSIQYKPGKANSNADGLSRLPTPTSMKEPSKLAELVHLMEYLDSSPVSSSQIRMWTDRDPLLSKVKQWTLSGWPADDTDDEMEELRPFRRRRYELCVEEGCVLWGSRVVVPPKGRSRVIQMLHEAHPGMSRMKGLARGYVWWPNMDEELEKCVKSCEECQSNRKSPPVAPMHAWSWPSKPWSRIHIDYAGPFMGAMFLVIVDAHTKWMEVHKTASSTTAATIGLLRTTFATLGLPEVVVSDNAANFTSDEFAKFLKLNKVQHVRTPSYHPASNGLVERAVQTFKDGMKKLKTGSVDTKLARFLFKYRITPQSSTGISPAELMFGRRLRSQLDNLRPDLGKKVQEAQWQQAKGQGARAKEREFVVGDLVYARNYSPGPKWLPGKVIEKVGSRLHTVVLADGRQVRKHSDQLLARAMPESTVVEAQEEANDSDSDVAEGPPGSRSATPELTEPDSPEISTNAHHDDDSRASSDSVVEDPSVSEEEPSQPPGPLAPNPSVPTTVRRSNRQSRPPGRFGDLRVH